jgi:hypothetical protein
MGAGSEPPLTMHAKGGFRQPMRIAEESAINGTKIYKGERTDKEEN